ncbi:MAG: peptidase domain-containing ABC transporter, partial [Cytophagales bacterium]|nr:peptidase domain-containing ABC transporter [Cytophagales bacterium]
MRAVFPVFKQLDQMDCGPTCLRMVAKHYGRNYPLHELRNKSFITREGVSLLGISDAAEAIGFRTLGVKIPFDKLFKDAVLPCVAHWYQRHFVVIYKITSREVFIADPAAGLVSYTHEEFKKGWLSAKENGQENGVALLLEPTPEFYEREPEAARNKRKSLTYLFGYLAQHRRFIIQLILGLLAGSIIQLALPFLTQSIVDVGINTQNIQFIYLVLAGQFVLFLSRLSVDFIRRWILLHLSTRINISIISDFLIKLFKLPMPFFEGKMIGDILRRIEDHTRIERFLSTSSLNILFSLFNLVIFGVVLVIYNVPIFLVFFSMSTVYVFFILLFLKKRAELDYKRFQQMADNQSNLIQSVQGMSEIKMNNCETQKRWEWERIQAKLFHINVQSTRLQQYQDAGSLFLNESKNMIITVMAALAVMNGDMTLGMMLAVQYIIGQLNAPVNEFIGFTRDFQDAKISLERIGEIHSVENEEPSPDLTPGPSPEERGAPRIKGDYQSSDNLQSVVTPSPVERGMGGEVKLKNLSFQYEGPHSPKVLDDIDLIIPEGKITAIVGASGSGKTTLMKLLLKFYKAQPGNITLGGVPLQNIPAAVWRQQCGTVMQDGFIFSDTIARNIALGDEEVDYKKLLHAVTVANIKEHIESLPLRYNTKVGANGIGLSQG